MYRNCTVALNFSYCTVQFDFLIVHYLTPHYTICPFIFLLIFSLFSYLFFLFSIFYFFYSVIYLLSVLTQKENDFPVGAAFRLERDLLTIRKHIPFGEAEEKRLLGETLIPKM